MPLSALDLHAAVQPFKSGHKIYVALKRKQKPNLIWLSWDLPTGRGWVHEQQLQGMHSLLLGVQWSCC